MTETPVSRLIGKLAVPTIISMLVSAIYNTADTFFVAQLGTSAAGAVGIVFSIMAIIQAIGFTIGMGAGSILSRQLGAKADREATETASSGFALALILSILLAVAGIVFRPQLMRLLGATETILPYAEAYAQYIFLGAPVMCCSFVMNNYLRAEGKAVYGMIGITTGGLLNILLDPLFIFTFGFGTAGAAMATALSQLISFCILLSFFLRGKSSVRIRLSAVSGKVKLYIRIITTGLPTLFRQGLASIANVALNVVAASFGDAAVAAMSIAGRINMLAFSAMLGFGQGYQPVASFNYGAKLYERVREATKFTAAAGTLIMLAVSIVCFAFAPAVIGAFRADDVLVMEIGVKALRLQMLLMPLTGLVTATNMGLQSTGNSGPATVLSMLRQGIFFLPLILIMPKVMGIGGVIAAQPLSDAFSFVVAVFFYSSFLKMLKQKSLEIK
ncbi:MAG: MATE family efflux transporter [Spirochaetes bacterium]|uniref:Multidrug export protein MepA n=1 Tax=Candidatus Ornithospirochaeta stercoripullorum TaxID=2840899 RepID=A0A9D9E1L3_9SPIO|nr:MATE family efflux transporter [Candidatus Ornithospirochaeta stercoripullorum]